MNKFKKLIAVLLTFVLCFAVCGIMSSAAETPVVILEQSYANNAATYVRITVKTSGSYGAIQGTLTYDKDISLVTTSPYTPVFAESADDIYADDGQGEIKFAVVTDDFVSGDIYWASFVFDINNQTKIDDFNLNATVADKAATEITEDNGRKANIQVVSTLGSLGSQFRPENDEMSTNKEAALRFGANLERTKSTSMIKVDGDDKKAVSCGAIIGYEFNIKNNGTQLDDISTLSSYFKVNSETGEVTKNTNLTGANAYVSTKYYASSADYLAYTFAISGITTNHATHGDLTKKAIVFLPYVIYEDGEGYGIKFGSQTSNTYDNVVNAYNFAKGQ